MRKPLILLFVLVLVASFAVPIYGQITRPDDQEPTGPGRFDGLLDFNRRGQSAMSFLGRGAGARLMGMADAGIAITGDASGLFYNPASIAYVENRSVMFGNVNWLLDTSIQSGAFAINLGNLGTFGLSAMYFNYGDPIKATEINATVEAGYSDIGELNPSEYALGLAYARQISAQFSVGAQLKYAHQDLLGSAVKSRIAYQDPDSPTGWAQESHTARTGLIAFDVGTIYNTGFRDLTLAMSFQNFGGTVEYERDAFDIPLTFKFGMTGELFTMLGSEMDDMGLDLRVDYLHPIDWSERVHLGAEYSLRNMLFLRGGYKFNYSSEGLTLGGGVNIDMPVGSVRVDYAYKGTGDSLFNAVHVYSIGIDF
ncbi:MAG TPA: PorV/PorQ family protein [bacterium]|nr:PorV/PorQ family protein [bacterium]